MLLVYGENILNFYHNKNNKNKNVY